MSDWELVQNNESVDPVQSVSYPQSRESDWEVIETPANSKKQHNNESFGAAVLKSPFRIGEDIYRGGMEALKSIPGYYQKAKTEYPGFYNVLREHPAHALGQGVAGIAELGHNLLNTPHELAEYGANRLNLLPESFAKNIPKQKDISGDLNQLFGQPKYPGESLIRGAGKNAINLIGAWSAATALNPLNLTNTGITNNVLKQMNKQIAQHTDRYNGLWRDAAKKGLNDVPFDSNILNQNLGIIKKYYTPKQYSSIENFISKPTLENAQRAQSDLGVLRRSIEENARTKPLLTEERNLHDSLANAEKHIEGNMFKDSSGNINKKLAKNYKDITNSYRENVVPYKYNRDIQAYLNKEITKKQLVQKLNTGEFAAKKGSSHPAFGVRNALIPAVGGVGALGGLNYLYNQMMGNEESK